MPALATDHACHSVLQRSGSHPRSTTIAASHVTCCLTISSGDHGSPLPSGTKLHAPARLQRTINRLDQILTRHTHLNTCWRGLRWRRSARRSRGRSGRPGATANWNGRKLRSPRNLARPQAAWRRHRRAAPPGVRNTKAATTMAQLIRWPADPKIVRARPSDHEWPEPA